MAAVVPQHTVAEGRSVKLTPSSRFTIQCKARASRLINRSNGKIVQERAVTGRNYVYKI